MLPDKRGAGRGIVSSGHNLTVKESVNAGVSIGEWGNRISGISDSIAGLAIQLATRRGLANERGKLLIAQKETVLPPGQLIDPSADNSDAAFKSAAYDRHAASAR